MALPFDLSTMGCARSIRNMVWGCTGPALLLPEPIPPMVAINPASIIKLNMTKAMPLTNMANKQAKKVLKKLFITNLSL